MIEVYKIVSGKYDSVIISTLIKSDTHTCRTRGNDLRLQKSNVKYDMRKFCTLLIGLLTTGIVCPIGL